MSAWGGSFRSCDPLIERVEKNDPTLVDLVVLPTKTFQDSHVDRLADTLRKGRNTHLRSIQASGHAVSNDSLCRLGQAIAAGKSQLASLAVGDLTMGDEGVCSLCRGLLEGRCCTLTSIDLSYKGIGPMGLQSVIRLAAENEVLSSINLSRNPGLVDESIANEETPIFTKIKDLDLSDCEMDANTARELVRRLVPSDAQRKLRLSHNPLGDKAANEIVGSHMSSLEELHLPNCGIGDDLWLNVPVVDSTVRTLDLSSNALTAHGVSLLGNALSLGMPHLVELNLSGNALNETGVELLIASLRKRAALVPLSLDLSDTNCTARAACIAIESDNNISSLRLFNNNLGSQGFHSLAAHLRGGHPALHTLDLAGNHANEAAVVELLSGLLENGDFESKLKTLIVGGNAGGQALEDVVHSIKRVRPELDIARDKIRKS